MKTQHLLFGAAIVLLLCSCQKEQLQSLNQVPAQSSKILGTKSEGSDSVLYVKFSQPPQAFHLDELRHLGVSRVEAVFPSTPGKEEIEAKYGLDKWYALSIDNPNAIDIIAAQLSNDNNISVVQFDCTYTKTSDCVSYPAGPIPAPFNQATKADMGTVSLFNDPYLPDQWHYINNGDMSIANSVYKGADINVKNVWSELTVGDKDIIVAVVDEGVKYTHPDLAASMWVNTKEKPGDGIDNDGNGYVDDVYGYNFVDYSSISWNTSGDTGHGTHVAGTIAAVNNNGTGVSGIAGGSGKADGIRIMSCQVFSGKSGGSPQTLAKALKYAADNGASIVSASLSYKKSTFQSDGAYKSNNSTRMEYDALCYFEAPENKNNPIIDGNIAIFASGNDGALYANYPGALNNIISVSAFGPDFLPTYYTNYGPGCNIVAPGGDVTLYPRSGKSGVLSTLPSELNNGKDYGYMQGTSMACPHVSGIVALGLSYAKKIGKTFGLQEFKNMILASANDFETRLASGNKDSSTKMDLYKYRKQMGTGSIDAWRLMMKIEGTPCLSAEVGKDQWLDLSQYFGTASVNLTYLNIECSETESAKVGLAKEPYIKNGRLWVHPTKCGSFRLRVHAVGGGEKVGGDEATGGMHISQDISIVVRTAKSDNGGWL